MTSYTDVFGGANIYPSEISYSALTLTTDIALNWPEETSAAENFATRIMDVTASVAGKKLILPRANEAGTGETILFNSLGSVAFTVVDYDGTQVLSAAPGTVWQIYLRDNSTVAGSWLAFQYGASVASTNASSLAGTGIVAIGTLLSQSVPITNFNSNYSTGPSDRAKMFVWTGSAGALTLPDAATVGNNWFMLLKNAGTGEVTVASSSASLIDTELEKLYQPGDSSIIASDGNDFYTIGFGQSAEFVFDYTVIDVSGDTDYTLTGSELNRIVYKFVGALTGNIKVIVPATVQQYWVDNATTGDYTLEVTTEGGSGIFVIQDGRAILYCDGTDVIGAETAGVSFPIGVSQGGTSATTAGGALINLGGTSTGIALFTAADLVAAWNALDGGIYFGASAPAAPYVGMRWINSDNGKIYTYFNDASSSQWVELV